MEIKDYLREARENAELSQKELANLLGVAPSAISRYETTDAQPRISFILKLADVLNMSLDTIFQRNQQNMPYTPPVPFNAILKQMRETKNLSKEQIAKSLNISIKTYENIENGHTLPSVQTLDKIVSFFEVPFDFITEFREPQILAKLNWENEKYEGEIAFNINENNNNITVHCLYTNFKAEITISEFYKVLRIAHGKTTNKLSEIENDLFVYELIHAIQKLKEKKPTPPEQSE